VSLARPTDFFGVGVSLPRDDAERLARALGSAWEAVAGRPTGELARDWSFLVEHYFDPIAQGGRLRRELDRVHAVVEDAPYLNNLLVLPIGDGDGLITLEGRAVLELLRAALSREGQLVTLPDDARWALERQLLDLYRDASRHRLDSVLSLRSGAAAPLLPPAVATILLLLLNRSTSPDRAITRPPDPSGRQHLDEALARPVLAFANTLAPGKRKLEHISLYSGYPLTEARRRLSSQLSTDPASLFVRPNEEDEVIRFVARDLAKRRLPEATIATAFDRMVEAYRESASALAAFGVGYERPADTRRLRERLLAQYREACEGC
jgi:hypothetical protein